MGKRRRPDDFIRVVFPDVHGAHADQEAVKAFWADVKLLNPHSIIGIGDLLDCGGMFSAHQRSYTNEMTESYEDDCAAANRFLDVGQAAAPRATWDLLEGNHEQHVERWVAREFSSRKDADAALELYSPQARLRLRERGMRYFRRSERYDGLSVHGTIKRGPILYTHGWAHGKHATAEHLSIAGYNVVHGHTHRAAFVRGRSMIRQAIGAWCDGTLAQLQPLYAHTRPTNWTHGYGLEYHSRSGRFLRLQIPIIDGVSDLKNALRAMGR